MNETIKNLVERRSIKNFQPKQIEDEQLAEVIKAGSYAACGKGIQAVRVVVIQKPSLIKQLSAMNAAILQSTADPFYGAPTVIVVLADGNKPTHVQDGSLVIGNIMTAAYSLGIDSCWINRAKEEFESPAGKELLKEWGIDENYVGVGHLVLGYRNCELPKAAPRRADFVMYVR